MENNINLDGLELTKVETSDDDEEELGEYIAQLPPLPPMTTEVDNTKRTQSLSVKSHSVAMMPNRKQLKTSNSVSSERDLKKIVFGKKESNNNNINNNNNKHNKSWRKQKSNKYQNKAKKNKKN